jgi:hypothetical protein
VVVGGGVDAILLLFLWLYFYLFLMREVAVDDGVVDVMDGCWGWFGVVW